ncbi:PAS domain S-box protein [Egbenema bharatensis]|uniref:PAS domain S-box protein n=1 Tax=Egbenema bharatensis TaxID=3463334 RepID=UPI003A8AB997
MSVVQPVLVILTPQTTVQDAIVQLDQSQSSFALVVDQQRWVGMFTAHHLIHTIAKGLSLTETTLAAVMSPPAIELPESAPSPPPSSQLNAKTAYLPFLPDSARLSLKRVLHCVEQSNQLLWEVFPNLLIRIRRDGTYLDFVPARSFKSFTPAPDLPGKTIFEVMPSDFVQERMHYVERALQTQQTQTYEYQLEFDGELHYQEAQITVSGEDEVLIIVRDITERKQLELALRASESRLSDVLNSANPSIVSVRVFANRTWEYNYYSPGCELVFGYTAEEMMTGIWWSRVHADDQTSVILPLFDDIFAERSVEVEYRFWHKDGSLRWIASQGSSHYEKTQNCWILTAVDTDITQRKQVEIALQESEERFREIAETVSQVFIIRCAKTGTFLYVSPAYEQIWQRTCESLYADPTSWMESIHPDDRPLLTQSLTQQFQGQPVVREYRLLRSDGSIRWIRASLDPIYAPDGELLRFIGISEDITDRKRAEEELRVSQQHLSLALETAKAGTWEFSLADGAVAWSDQCFQLLGYDKNQVAPSYENWLRAIHPDDLEKVQQEVERSLSKECYFQFDFRIVHQDGSVRWLTERGQSLCDQEGKVTGAIGILLDITERKRIEEELRESQRFIQSITDASPNLFYLYDIHQSRNVYVNRRIEQVLGYTAEEVQAIQSRLIETLMHPDDSARFGQNIPYIMAMADGEVFEFEYRMLGKNGEWRWLRSLDTVFERTPDGQPKLLLGTAIDVTERKQAAEALEHSERKYRDLVELASSIILRFDTSGRITFLNEYGQQFFGYSEPEIINRNLVGTIVPKIESTGRNLRLLIAKLCQDPINYPLSENENIRCNGERVWVQWSDKPIYNDRGELVEILSVGVDITERKRAQEQLARPRKRLKLPAELKVDFCR